MQTLEVVGVPNSVYDKVPHGALVQLQNLLSVSIILRIWNASGKGAPPLPPIAERTQSTARPAISNQRVLRALTRGRLPRQLWLGL